MRANQREVILYGDSLILQGVRASLEACPDLKLITLEPTRVALQREITALGPVALIFDTSAVQPGFPGFLLQQPDLLLIGLDPETHQALIWTGRQKAAVESADLVEVIFQMDSISEFPEKVISQLQGKEAAISSRTKHRKSTG